MRGIDIHPVYQFGIRWDQVPTDKEPGAIGFCWVKLSDGSRAYVGTGPDGKAAYPSTLVAGARSRRIPVGGYHYAQKGDPVAQANLFINEVERLNARGIVPMLDLEAPFIANKEARDFAIAFLRQVVSRGYRPGIYMNDSFATALKPDSWGIPNLVVWIARYGALPKNRHDIHQFASDGRVPGIPGNVDVNDSKNNSLFTQEAIVAAGLDNDDVGVIMRYGVIKDEFWATGKDPKDADLDEDYVRLYQMLATDPIKIMRGIADEVAALKAQLGGVVTPEIDYDRLAAALLPGITDKLTKAVNDEIARRMQS